MNTSELYSDLSRERSFAQLGLGNNQALAEAEAKWAHAVEEEMESRTVETEILQRFNMRHLELPEPSPLQPLGMDEFLCGHWIFDGWNNSKRWAHR